MLLQNNFFSSLYTYLLQLESYIEKGQTVVTTANVYDKESGDEVAIRWDKFKTTLQFSADIILKEIEYKGYLKCSYNKRTHEVLVSHVPYVQYGDVKTPLFTADIVRLLVKSLNKYISGEELKIRFSSDSTVIAIDKSSLSLIPSIRDTNNYILLERVISTIDREKRKIDGDVKRYREKMARLEAARERAIAKKRKIYGLDPKEFESTEKFLETLSNLLADIYSKKVVNTKRNLEASKKAYCRLMMEALEPEEINLFKELEEAFEELFKKVKAFLKVEKDDVSYIDFVEYLDPDLGIVVDCNHFVSDVTSFIMEKFDIDNFDYSYFLDNDESKVDNKSFSDEDEEDFSDEDEEDYYVGFDNDLPVNGHIHNFIYDESRNIKDLLMRVINYMNDDWEKLVLKHKWYVMAKKCEQDFEEEEPILNLIKAAQKELNERKERSLEITFSELSQGEQNLWRAGEAFSLMILWRIYSAVNEDSEKLPSYHPIFCGTRVERYEYGYLGRRRIVGWDYEADFKRIKNGASLLLQIEALRIQLRYYELIQNDPLKAMDSFSKDSNLWGNIMRIPYFIRKDKDPYDHKESFNLLMIKPGYEEVDFSSIKYYSDDYGKRFGRRQTERAKIYFENSSDCECTRFMACIPKSLSIESIKSVVDYMYKATEYLCEGDINRLNFVCEDLTSMITLKSYLIEKEYERYLKKGFYYPRRELYINVDPTYYDNFIVNTPNNKVFWHQYDYNSSYRFHRKLGISLSIQIGSAIKIILETGEKVSVEQIKHLLLGEYLEEETRDYALLQEELKELSNYVTEERRGDFIYSIRDNSYVMRKQTWEE